MNNATGHEYEIELAWRQTAPGEWVALLRDRATGQQREARSERELWAVLESFVSGAPAGSAGKQSSNQTDPP